MERVFSGIQPTGDLHIGNYLGAIRNWVTIQSTHQCLFCIVDYHAITIEYDVPVLRQRILDLSAGLLACGVDPSKAALYVQSEVPQHTELSWIFTCLTPMGELGRQTQFKAKSETNAENINAGLFCYPVLQAADILLYKATKVPVGQDQEQHLELSREIARKFNARFGQTFPEPHTMFTTTPKILGLDGKAKMSKSLGNSIALNETPEAIGKKLATAFTDPNRLRKSDPGNPDVCNVYSLHKFFSDSNEVAQINADCRSAQLGCVDCKKKLTKSMSSHLEPIAQKWEQYRSDISTVEDVLAQGRKTCTTLAEQTMDEVHHKMGLRTR